MRHEGLNSNNPAHNDNNNDSNNDNDSNNGTEIYAKAKAEDAKAYEARYDVFAAATTSAFARLSLFCSDVFSSWGCLILFRLPRFLPSVSAGLILVVSLFLRAPLLLLRTSVIRHCLFRPLTWSNTSARYALSSLVRWSCSYPADNHLFENLY